ncbi:FkbM family methyltransferase [Brachyspira pilosicoli]|mgnify:CR=1 FL=1|uniref:SAM-dependent methyltransferase n=1 Tax=Brachyspira pilosicoli B2904 TaxID=1133568 RepID=J9UE01_BRAPL|nr:FkbM family methyltransferase [Brachyspira pilosicoli]AFR70291.1 SAM-dependent methyltransferase [Brachyspira pilosicoli B2904]PLV58574.1 hypothetical protein BPSP16_07955 [Brachyspira pilosicoli SP16]
MDKEFEKTLNDVVWWIPFKKVREIIRNLFVNIYKISLNTNNILLNTNNVPTINWHFTAMREYMINNPDEFNNKVEKFKNGLDDYSIEYLNCYIRQLKYIINPKVIGMDFFKIDNSISDFFTEEQKFLYFNYYNIYNFYYKRYLNKYNNQINFDPHINYYEAGIVFLPNKIKNRFNDSIAIDCGAYIGDSAIMMYEEYTFKNIYAFEPDGSNFEKMQYIITNYNLSERIIPVKYATSNKNEINYIVSNGQGSFVTNEYSENSEKIESIKLDDYFKDNDNISLIKMDIEGFEKQALEGAEQLIKRCKPALLISCYHGIQMFELKNYIENLDLGYKIIYRCLSINTMCEYNLICYVE